MLHEKLSNRYEILSAIGAGGMGEVYRAKDTKLNREVAIKILPESISANAEYVSRFEVEAQALAALSHPNILTIYDFVTENGKSFAVMELLKGETLASRISQGKMPLGQTLELAAAIAGGLAAAHKASVIHRDLKPANIFLCESGAVKILDFGLARLVAVENAEGKEQSTLARITRSGVVLGTVAYMSPEQARGGHLDERTDIFSFGAVLYEMITGELPFRGRNTGEMLEALFTKRPTSPVRLNPNVPVALEQILNKALEKDRLLRYQSVEEMRSDLEKCKKEGFGLRNAITIDRLQKAEFLPTQLEVARHANRKLLIGTTVIVVVFLLAAFFYNRREVPLQPEKHVGPAVVTPVPPAYKADIVVLPFRDMSPKNDQEYLSDGLTEELTHMLSRNPKLRVISRTSAFSFKGKEVDIKTIGEKLKVTHVLEGSVQKAGSQLRITAQLIEVKTDSHLWSQSYDRGMENIFALQDDIASSVTGALKATLENGQSIKRQETTQEVFNLCLLGRHFHYGNKEELEKSVSYFKHAITKDPNYAPAWAGLAMAHGRQAYNGFVPVDEGYGKGRKEIEKALALDPNLGEAYEALGWLKMHYDHDWVGAEAAHKRAIELDPGNDMAVVGRAEIAIAFGRVDEAIRLQRGAIEVNPLSARAYRDLGLSLWYAGQFEEAKVAIRKCLELAPDFKTGHTMLGRIYLAQNKPEEALVEMQKEVDPGFLLQGLVLAYHALGKNKESDAALAKFLENNWWFQTAEVYGFRGEKDKAFEWLEHAYNKRDGDLKMMKGDPLLRSLHNDPRWSDFLMKMKLPVN